MMIDILDFGLGGSKSCPLEGMMMASKLSRRISNLEDLSRKEKVELVMV